MTEWSTGIIAMTNALGNLVRFTLIPGRHYDTVGAAFLPEPADFRAILANKACDVHRVVDSIRAQGTRALTP
ncbi:hypothetical protein [Komagataeibacter swingsii]|uniref:Uncharacterized protein n=1 Tax=Komagataeibacter swingsii TaxID=215220 RepID=A0A2V4RNE2_9PROT|nr:hypothetical protein [Komagataeibacter swingsii]PYD70494.1 hypothetical protein CFR76_03760 [Komagataeibacter swingsii]GBQ59287.1 transposase [Komagataeibacter swingsii DSM 16373]